MTYNFIILHTYTKIDCKQGAPYTLLHCIFL